MADCRSTLYRLITCFCMADYSSALCRLQPYIMPQTQLLLQTNKTRRYHFLCDHAMPIEQYSTDHFQVGLYCRHFSLHVAWHLSADPCVVIQISWGYTPLSPSFFRLLVTDYWQYIHILKWQSYYLDIIDVITAEYQRTK